VSAHPVTWQAPQPLWARFGAGTEDAATAADQARPAILRFATDEFMDEMLGTLARDPSRLDALVARPETWRQPIAPRAELIERTPIPRVAQSSVRRTFARKVKGAVAATVAEADITTQGQTRTVPLKLYQPAHQRFYVVSASLVCGLPGFPERAAVSGAAEQINFVLRRLLPSSTGAGDLREFAFVKDTNGARWQRVSDGPQATDSQQSVAGEELLPVFPLAYHDDSGLPRKLWGGMVPVGRREEYTSSAIDRQAPPPFPAAQVLSLDAVEPPSPVSKMARVAQFQMEVAEPWKTLIRSSVKEAITLSGGSPLTSDSEPLPARRKRIFEFNLQQQNTSWLILLDFADYLDVHLHDVWNAIASNGAGAASLPTQRKNLYDWLGNAVMSLPLRTALKPTDLSPEIRTPIVSMRTALLAIRAQGVREALEAMELAYTNTNASLSSAGWPPFHFVLAGVDTAEAAAGPFANLNLLGASSGPEFAADPVAPPNAAPQANDVDKLTALVGRALDARVETDAPPVPFALEVKNALAATAGDAGWFVIRFVYQQRDCGPLHPPALSAPTQRFQLASFFDPDAPARPIRIALPLDTSPAGLRKFNKNTAFIMSDMLCGQVQRAKGLGFIDLVRAVLPWPLHKDLEVGSGGPCTDGSFSLGMICSISIPIITICALILLMIIVSLLDLVFHWLPYFVFCFPLPRFKGKS
jgi:hypothetical protein